LLHTWSYIPANIYLGFRLIYTVLSSSELKQLDVYRKKFGLVGTVPTFDPYHSDVHYLCSATPNTDYSVIIPDNVTPCGPILLPAAAVEESDPLLAAWLENGPTVMVNLGTHASSDKTFAFQLASGLRVLLDKEKEIQILWKLKGNGDIQDALTELGYDVNRGRVKIMDWLVADPLAILRHPNVVCSVHHGGANSFFEAVATGIPQIVLAMWHDTYGYATRVEWLGVGINGNRSVAPGVDAAEFGQALTRIVGTGNEALSFRAAANALAEDCRRYEGRVLACEKVLEQSCTSE